MKQSCIYGVIFVYDYSKRSPAARSCRDRAILALCGTLHFNAAYPYLFTLWGLGFLANIYCEAAIITLSFVIACYSLIGGYKQTRSVGPLITLAVGFAFIFAAQFWASEVYEWMLMVAGGLLVGSAHFYNWKVVHKASVKPNCCANSQCPNA